VTLPSGNPVSLRGLCTIPSTAGHEFDTEGQSRLLRTATRLGTVPIVEHLLHRAQAFSCPHSSALTGTDRFLTRTSDMWTNCAVSDSTVHEVGGRRCHHEKGLDR
jgi:hypothetical protein